MGNVELDSRQMVELTGLSYRQLNVWTTSGHLRAVNQSPGSGHRMLWPAGEVLVARVMRILVRDFEMSPGKASLVARAGGLEAGDSRCWVVLVWEGDVVAGPVRDSDPGRAGSDRARAPAGVPG